MSEDKCPDYGANKKEEWCYLSCRLRVKKTKKRWWKRAEP